VVVHLPFTAAPPSFPFRVALSVLGRFSPSVPPFRGVLGRFWCFGFGVAGCLRLLQCLVLFSRRLHLNLFSGGGCWCFRFVALQHCSFGGSGDLASLAPASVSWPRYGLLVSMVLMAFPAAPTVLVFGLCVLFIYVLFV
jgi:hypothetical protein